MNCWNQELNKDTTRLYVIHLTPEELILEVVALTYMVNIFMHWSSSFLSQCVYTIFQKGTIISTHFFPNENNNEYTIFCERFGDEQPLLHLLPIG